MDKKQRIWIQIIPEIYRKITFKPFRENINFGPERLQKTFHKSRVYKYKVIVHALEIVSDENIRKYS